MSKRKLTRTTSLSINDEEYTSRPRNSEKFVVTGNDDFIPGNLDAEEMTTEPQQPIRNGHAYGTMVGKETEGTGSQRREIVSFQRSRPLSTDFTLENIRTKMRDNALIW